MDFVITSFLYIALGILALGFISGAFFYGFSTPIRAGISIIFLILFYNFMFLSQKESPTVETFLVYIAISIFVLYNLKQLGILSIFLIFISTNNHHSTHNYSTTLTKENKECQRYYVNTEVLNLRKRPSISSDKVDFLSKGTKVCISKKEGNWSYINDQGWVAYKYLTTKEP